MQRKKEEQKKDTDEFSRFVGFARKIVNVPKKEIDEQERIYQMKKEKEKAKT